MANADTITQSGIPYPVAIEIAKQMNAGVGNVQALMTLGVGNAQAIELSRQINAVSFDSDKLARSNWNPQIAKLLKEHSGH
jgi:hypothetical protein